MKFAKPFIVLYALVGVVAVSFAKYVITKMKIRPMYKYVAKLGAAKTELYRLMFNPCSLFYSFSQTWMPANADHTADLQRCHEIISQARLSRSVG